MQRFLITDMEYVHKRGYLSQQAVVAYDFGLAISRATLLAKADSFIKFSTDIREYASSRAVTISSNVPLLSSFDKCASPQMSHERALHRFMDSFTLLRISDTVFSSPNPDRYFPAPASLYIVGEGTKYTLPFTTTVLESIPKTASAISLEPLLITKRDERISTRPSRNLLQTVN